MKKRIHSIDGWRAVAALGVLYTHVWAMLKFPTLLIGRIDVMKLLNIWGNGVHLFFVISGLCFFIVMHKQKGNNIATAIGFWKKRWVRIAPAFYMACTVFTILNFKVLKSRFPLNLISNFLFIQTYIPNTEISGIFWSLSVEWIFYMVLPLLFYFMGNIGYLKMISVIILSGFLLNICHYIGLIYKNDFTWYYTFFANYEHFGWGILLGYFYINQVQIAWLCKGYSIVMGLLVAYLGKMLFGANFVANVGYLGFLAESLGPLVMTLGFAMMVYTALNNETVANVIGNRYLSWIGRISYSFYLWHALVLGIVYYFFNSYIPHTAFGVLITIILVLVGLLPISYTSYTLLESFYFKKDNS